MLFCQPESRKFQLNRNCTSNPIKEKNEDLCTSYGTTESPRERARHLHMCHVSGGVTQDLPFLGWGGMNQPCTQEKNEIKTKEPPKYDTSVHQQEREKKKLTSYKGTPAAGPVSPVAGLCPPGYASFSTSRSLEGRLSICWKAGASSRQSSNSDCWIIINQ